MVTLNDIGHSIELERWASELGAQVTRLELASQFRCNGSDGYLAWHAENPGWGWWSYDPLSVEIKLTAQFGDSEFLGYAAHQLRTPVAGARAAAALLQRGAEIGARSLQRGNQSGEECREHRDQHRER